MKHADSNIVHNEKQNPAQTPTLNPPTKKNPMFSKNAWHKHIRRRQKGLRKDKALKTGSLSTYPLT